MSIGVRYTAWQLNGRAARDIRSGSMSQSTDMPSEAHPNGLADHLDVRLGLQQAADTPADDFVVIQEEHADRLSRRIAGRLGAHRA